MKTATAIVKSLKAQGVKYVFGYPGATIAPFYDALYSEKSIEHVLVRHEQHAGHAASGYARVSSKVGVCCATSGPGATNLITAIATAYADSIPIVAITGQVDSSVLGRDVFQEADIKGACEPFTKYSYLVKDALAIPRVIKEAFYIASTGRPGPVLIDIPVDVQLESHDFDFDIEVDIPGYKPNTIGHPGQIKRLLREIKSAKRPLLCVGGGVFASKVENKLAQFVDVAKIPVVSTLMGLGSVATTSPYFCGQVGMHGKTLANEVLSRADVLILFGARVSDRTVMLTGKLSRATKIIHIDIDPAEIGKNLDTYLPIVGDLGDILSKSLASPSLGKDVDDKLKWLMEIEEIRSHIPHEAGERAGFVNPKVFVYELSKRLGEGFVYCADVGQNQLWSAGNVLLENNGRFITTGGMGTMGYSIGAAVGAKLATLELAKSKSKPRQVVAVCGDGAFQMCMMELATVVQQGIDIKVIVMHNGKLGLVREIQDNSYAGRHSAVDLQGSPDPVKIATAYGIRGFYASNMQRAIRCLDELLASDEPGLMVVEVPYDEATL